MIFSLLAFTSPLRKTVDTMTFENGASTYSEKVCVYKWTRLWIPSCKVAHFAIKPESKAWVMGKAHHDARMGDPNAFKDLFVHMYLVNGESLTGDWFKKAKALEDELQFDMSQCRRELNDTIAYEGAMFGQFLHHQKNMEDFHRKMQENQWEAEDLQNKVNHELCKQAVKHVGRMESWKWKKLEKQERKAFRAQLEKDDTVDATIDATTDTADATINADVEEAQKDIPAVYPDTVDDE